MAVSQSDIDAINFALGQGEKLVEIDGKRVMYHSPTEMILARDNLMRVLEQQNAAAGVKPARPRIVYHTQDGRGY